MENTNNIEKTDKKEEASTHKIGIYLWIWTLLFVLSFFSYMVINIILHVLKSRADNGIFHAPVLGKICIGKRSFMANDGYSLLHIFNGS
jgi:hypothetical protein